MKRPREWKESLDLSRVLPLEVLYQVYSFFDPAGNDEDIETVSFLVENDMAFNAPCIINPLFKKWICSEHTGKYCAKRMRSVLPLLGDRFLRAREVRRIVASDYDKLLESTMYYAIQSNDQWMQLFEVACKKRANATCLVLLGRDHFWDSRDEDPHDYPINTMLKLGDMDLLRRQKAKDYVLQKCGKDYGSLESLVDFMLECSPMTDVQEKIEYLLEFIHEIPMLREETVPEYLASLIYNRQSAHVIVRALVSSGLVKDVKNLLIGWSKSNGAFRIFKYLDEQGLLEGCDHPCNISTGYKSARHVIKLFYRRWKCTFVELQDCSLVQSVASTAMGRANQTGVEKVLDNVYMFRRFIRDYPDVASNAAYEAREMFDDPTFDEFLEYIESTYLTCRRIIFE